MKNLRILGLFTLLCLLAASASLSAAPAGPEPAAPTVVDQPLPWEVTSGLCGQEPADGTEVLPVRKGGMQCFCVEDRQYCRRNYGSLWYCNPDPCQCEPI